MSPFERGWHCAVERWRDGFTLEDIEDEAHEFFSPEYQCGMLACVDAMCGFRAVAKVAALEWVSARKFDELVETIES